LTPRSAYSDASTSSGPIPSAPAARSIAASRSDSLATPTAAAASNAARRTRRRRDRRPRLELALALDERRESPYQLEVAPGPGGVGLQRLQRVVEVAAALADVGLERPEHSRRERAVFSGRKPGSIPPAGPGDAQEVLP